MYYFFKDGYYYDNYFVCSLVIFSYKYFVFGKTLGRENLVTITLIGAK